jgi:dTDP-4-dehydrorhamnose 3,5-epimerase-like enzyme
MLHFVTRYFVHSDERGSIEGLINKGNWQELNLITSDAGIVRGNHYHKKTQELFIILEGDIEVQTQAVDEGKLVGNLSIHKVKAGDVFLVEPMTNHIFTPHKPSKWINALSEPVDNEHPDFFRIESPHA